MKQAILIVAHHMGYHYFLYFGMVKRLGWAGEGCRRDTHSPLPSGPGG